MLLGGKYIQLHWKGQSQICGHSLELICEEGIWEVVWRTQKYHILVHWSFLEKFNFFLKIKYFILQEKKNN